MLELYSETPNFNVFSLPYEIYLTLYICRLFEYYKRGS